MSYPTIPNRLAFDFCKAITYLCRDILWAEAVCSLSGNELLEHGIVTLLAQLSTDNNAISTHLSRHFSHNVWTLSDLFGKWFLHRYTVYSTCSLICEEFECVVFQHIPRVKCVTQNQLWRHKRCYNEQCHVAFLMIYHHSGLGYLLRLMVVRTSQFIGIYIWSLVIHFWFSVYH